MRGRHVVGVGVLSGRSRRSGLMESFPVFTETLGELGIRSSSVGEERRDRDRPDPFGNVTILGITDSNKTLVCIFRSGS